MNHSEYNAVDEFMEWRKTRYACWGLPAWVIAVLRAFVEWQSERYKS